MQFRFLVTFLLIGQLSFGQTDKHIKVPGTKCSLIPPPGFVAATNFSGFQHAETGASIMINEIPGPYETTVGSFTAEALKAKGMALVSKQPIDFNNSQATLVNLTQAANGTTYVKQILIFGDTKGTVLVNGIYPQAAKSIESKIKDALLSTVYSASQSNNPLDQVSFTIDINNTDFKLVKFISGSLLYSTDGKIPTAKPTLIVGSSLAKVPATDQKKYAEDRMKKLPGGEFSVTREITGITVDNLKGYEIVADGKTKDGKPALVYEVMLYNDKGDYYIIVGQANEDFEKNLETYRKVARTFKRK